MTEPSHTEIMKKIVHLTYFPCTAEEVHCPRPSALARSRSSEDGWHNLEGEEFQPFNRKGRSSHVQDCCILSGNQLVIPEAMRQGVLEELHAGHPGVSRMKAIAQSIVWWPGIDGEIEAKVCGYSECQVNQKAPAAAPMHPWEWPARPWSRIHIDYAEPFLGKMFLIVVDAHSKWMEVELVPAATSAYTIQKIRAMFATHSLPELLVSDNGTAVTSAEFLEFLRCNGVSHFISAPYQELSRELYKPSSPTCRRVQMRTCRSSCRGSSIDPPPHSTTDLSPAEMLMGRRLRTHMDLMRPDVSNRVRTK